jgi:carboxyl-terminal processing protease
VHENYVDAVDAKTLFEGALSGMFESLDDPHSTYLTASDMQDLTDDTSGKFGGVGLYISKPSRQEIEEGNNGSPPYVRVVAPIDQTPASRSGISAGDYIIRIEGESTIDLSIDEVVERLRGKPGTTVNVSILRGEDIIFDVALKRDIIEIPFTRHAMIHDSIGYLRIIQFSSLTAKDVTEALDSFQRRGYSGLIIDVRNNPGGLLKSVVDIADLFLPGGTIVSTRSRIPSENKVFSAKSRTRVSRNIPIIVLIDKGSASASEILAGALKDRNRATLVGETTFGKGSVQQIKSFGEGGFKLTMSRYFTPSGNNIDKIGIEPDTYIAEREFTEEENESYKRLINENLIPEFVRNTPDADEREINRFVISLKNDGIVIEDRILKRLIRNELNKTNNEPPVYDLEFDLVLQKAVSMLENGEVSVR